MPQPSPEGRGWTGALTAIMTGEAYATSAEMAGQLGAFPAYTRDTWEANGGEIYVEVDGPGSVTALRIVIVRTHRAR